MRQLPQIEIARTPNGFTAKKENTTLRINLPIDEETATEIFAVVFSHEDHLDGLLKDPKLTCPVYIKNNQIIFPDPLFRFPWDEKCMAEYKQQIIA